MTLEVASAPQEKRNQSILIKLENRKKTVTRIKNNYNKINLFLIYRKKVPLFSRKKKDKVQLDKKETINLRCKWSSNQHWFLSSCDGQLSPTILSKWSWMSARARRWTSSKNLTRYPKLNFIVEESLKFIVLI